MTYKNIMIDETIFHSFLLSCEPEVCLDKLKEECYNIKSICPTKKYSNRGGYHSPSFGNNNKFAYNYDVNDYPELSKLERIVDNFSMDYLQNRKYNLKISHNEWWININPANCYNILHNHNRSDLIAIFYVQSDDKNSSLTIIRNDGSMYSNLYANKSHQLRLNIPPIPGRLYLMPGHLLHYVSPNEENSDGISISYNLFVTP